jgi:hypothetical protein
MPGDALSGPDGTQPPDLPVVMPDALGPQVPARRFEVPAPRLPAVPAPAARAPVPAAEETEAPTGPIAAEDIAQAQRAGPRSARGSAVPDEVRGGSRPTEQRTQRRKRASAALLILLVLFLLVLAYNLVYFLYSTFH